MTIFTSLPEMQQLAERIRQQGKRIGVVPTMGALHAGHLSLIQHAQEKTDIVITTIFVNPKQFGPTEDFEKYPRDIDRDVKMIEECGCDIVFIPKKGEMYPEQFATFVGTESYENILEGKSRPSHFRGVTTVVAKLLHITKPHVAVFGQKDAQQVFIVRKMVRDLNFDVQIITAPIIRESDGLAMSSRNVYLSSEERKEACVLFQSLQRAEKLITEGERVSSNIIFSMKNLVEEKPNARLDYISIADWSTLEEMETIRAGKEILISLAVRFGNTRLIDNTVVNV